MYLEMTECALPESVVYVFIRQVALIAVERHYQ